MNSSRRISNAVRRLPTLCRSRFLPSRRSTRTSRLTCRRRARCKRLQPVSGKGNQALRASGQDGPAIPGARRSVASRAAPARVAGALQAFLRDAAKRLPLLRRFVLSSSSLAAALVYEDSDSPDTSTAIWRCARGLTRHIHGDMEMCKRTHRTHPRGYGDVQEDSPDTSTGI